LENGRGRGSLLAMDETPEQPTPVRRLTRSQSDAIIGGVASGLGRYFNADPILFRIGFVALSLVGGLGLFAYLAMLAFVPSDGEPSTTGSSRAIATGGAVVLGIALVIFLGAPFFFLGPGLLVIAVVGLAAVMLWRAVGRDTGGDPARTIARIALGALVAFLVAGAAIGVGIAAALGGGVVIASLAVATGLVMIATAFFGGVRWLIIPALALVLPLGVVAAADLDLDGGVGDRYYRPSSVAELHDKYQVGIGELDVDLRDLDLPAGRTDVAVDVGMGDAVVWVPEEACVTSDVAIGVGGADVFDRDNTGVDVAFDEAATPRAGQPHLHIDADVGIGVIEVVREGFAPDWLHDRDRGFGRSRLFDDDGPPRERFAEGGTRCA
jgi:phage shock protein PspC (stress-responsive transcriptional regulator)